MSRIAYVNGQYVRHQDAAVNIEDRGYQFADGVYEVIAAVAGRLVDSERHFERLERSLSELRIAPPCARRVLYVIAREVLRRNNVQDGILYLQITRGVAPRSHAFPANSEPSLVMTASRRRRPPSQLVSEGVAVITIEDTRWRRTDIKSVSLLANVLGKQLARDLGAHEAWLVDSGGFITEGTSSNAWIVTSEGEVVTRPVDHSVLAGITRLAVLDVAREQGIPLVERAFSAAEAYSAAEAFMTSTTSFVVPVTSIDGRKIGDGRPGPLTRTLTESYLDHVANGIATA
jgi:D-alanine transaminase